MVRGFLLLLIAFLIGCSEQKPVDLQQLEGAARGGDTEALQTLVELFSRSDNDLAGRSYKIVVALGDRSIPVLMQNLSTTSPDALEHVVAALGTLNASEAVEKIAELLKDPATPRRYIAAWSLGEIRDPRGIPALVSSLSVDEPLIVRYATRSLIKMNRLAVPALVEYLRNGEEKGRAAAILALGDIGDPSARDALIAQVGGAHRLEVYAALGKLKDPAAEQVLIEGLSHADWKARMNAAMALGSVGTAASVPGLETTLEDEVVVVREWSARSLEMVTGKHYQYRNEKGEQVAPYNIYH